MVINWYFKVLVLRNKTEPIVYRKYASFSLMKKTNIQVNGMIRIIYLAEISEIKSGKIHLSTFFKNYHMKSSK